MKDKDKDIEKTRELARGVEGWLLDEEGELLYHLAEGCARTSAIVEIGSWKGKSTIWLGKGTQAGQRAKVYAVDPHTGSSEHRTSGNVVDTYGAFLSNIEQAGVRDMIVPIRRTSQDAATAFDQPVELLFIDGAHEYNMVRLDFELWFPKVVDHGTICFHDTHWPGPNRLVKEAVFRSSHVAKVRIVKTIICGQKVAVNSVGDRMKNRYVCVLKNVYDATAALQLPEPIRAAGYRMVQRLQA